MEFATWLLIMFRNSCTRTFASPWVQVWASDLWAKVSLCSPSSLIWGCNDNDDDDDDDGGGDNDDDDDGSDNDDDVDEDDNDNADAASYLVVSLTGMYLLLFTIQQVLRWKYCWTNLGH